MARSEREAKAKDLVQESLETIRGKYKSMDFDSGFFFWANQTLRNTIGNDFKKERRRAETFVRPNSETFLIYGSTQRMEDDYDYKELLESIRVNIGKLSDVCKRVLLVFFNEGSRSDVLDLFPGKSTGYIDNMLFRCRQKLRELLRASGYAL